MSSKARRIVAPSTQPFDWAGSGSPVPAKPVAAKKSAASAPAPVVDAAAQAAHLAALERDAFSKGFAQGERAGAEAAGKRGEVDEQRRQAPGPAAEKHLVGGAVAGMIGRCRH